MLARNTLMRTVSVRRLFAAALALFAFVLGAGAQPPGGEGAFPTRPIRLIVPFPPGAGTDAVARLVARELGDALNTSVVIDNRTGAGGAIGAIEAAKADPDGYTLLFVASPFTTVAAASRNAGYDPVHQFEPVAPIAVGPLAFVVGNEVPATSMRELVALSKAKPGTLNYGSAGLGSINHLALELLKSRTGADLTHIPYKGIAPATMDLLSGQIQAMTASIPATLPYFAQNRVRVLAVTGPRRSPLMPDVPTWQEAGVPRAEVINYWGIVAPAGVSHEIVMTINAAVQRVLKQADLRERLQKEGVELIAGSPDRLGTLIATDLARWQKLVAEANLTLD